MCNRFRSIRDWSNLPPLFAGAGSPNFEFNPNVAPSEIVPAILATTEGPHARLARFGIDRRCQFGKGRPSLKNARTDGLRRGQFSRLLRFQRCVVPCEGFYEWREEDGGRQPYMFSRKDGRPILLAGIWDEAEYKGDRRPAFAILTDEPNALIAPYHNRMPVALKEVMLPYWLDPTCAAPLDLPLMLDLDAFEVRPMNRALNSVYEKTLAAIEPYAA